jgi:flagellar hook protein FlgE
MGVSYDLNALSGINAASNGLGVISNNLANSQSIGFKSSRAEFADMFSGPQNTPGNGVRVAAITQDFSQGTINSTGRDLDMAIDGAGFFILEDQTGKFGQVYTRNGSFKLDSEGYLTSQEGNRVQGYLLNQETSTETVPDFQSTLGSIDLDALNKEPKATDQMAFNINLDGQERNNHAPDGDEVNQIILEVNRTVKDDLISQLVAGGITAISANNAAASVLNAIDISSVMHATSSLASAELAVAAAYDAIAFTVGGAAASVASADASVYGNNIVNNGYDSMVTRVDNLLKLINPESNGNYEGFPDFSTNKIIHDTLGGEHRLTTNFYKRDVVEADNSDTGEKYSSWIVQYTIEDYDQENDEWVTSGHRFDQTSQAATTEAGMIFEVRFDTNGELIDVRQPASAKDGAYDSSALTEDVIGSGYPLNTATAAPAPGWDSISTQPSLSFIIDSPITGANDPLGNPIDTVVSIEMDLDEMTQYAGTYNLRGVSQNGYQIGDLVGITTGQDGIISARYSNGRSVAVAQLALGNFTDLNAMEKLGGQTYAETFASGTVQIGQPQSVGMGTINSGSLEFSNVDVAGELVNMIQTQRTYQASAQVISTSQQLTQTILNL